MTSKTKDQIKTFFQTGDKPTEAQFIDTIDSWVDKSGPVGTLETALSANPTGVVIAGAGAPSIASYNAVRASMGISVYDPSTAIAGVAGSYTTTAQVSAEIFDNFATTAQAIAGAIHGAFMDPVLTKNLFQAFAATASNTVFGLVAIANASASFDGSDADRALTPAGFSGNKSLAASGYYKFPGGLILQWGKYTGGANNPTVSFPVQFPAALFSVVAIASMAASNNPSVLTTNTEGTSSFKCDQRERSGGSVATSNFYWFAVGN